MRAHLVAAAQEQRLSHSTALGLRKALQLSVPVLLEGEAKPKGLDAEQFVYFLGQPRLSPLQQALAIKIHHQHAARCAASGQLAQDATDGFL